MGDSYAVLFVKQKNGLNKAYFCHPKGSIDLGGNIDKLIVNKDVLLEDGSFREMDYYKSPKCILQLDYTGNKIKEFDLFGNHYKLNTYEKLMGIIGKDGSLDMEHAYFNKQLDRDNDNPCTEVTFIPMEQLNLEDKKEEK